MRFWDSSALLPLFLEQEPTEFVRDLLRADGRAVTWVLSDIEVRSGLARLVRDGAITHSQSQDAAADLDGFWHGAEVVVLVDPVKSRARRLLGLHPLRAADALQLAAALVFADDDPRGVELVTFDLRLAEAARNEGFRVLPR